MLKTCINVVSEYKKWLAVRDPYDPGDGGYNYLDRLNSLLHDLREAGIKVNKGYYDEEKNIKIPDCIEFKTVKQAEKFYNECKWLEGRDPHWFSCEVRIKQEGKKVFFDGWEW